jgi:hypothetical protein
MTKNDMRERHPLRVLERAIGGGLGRGNIGVVLSRHGVGKTGFMIGLAIDTLLQGRKVLHISTKESVERTREFYDLLFKHMAADLGLDDLARRHLEMERHRHILVYNRDTFSLAKLEQSVAFLQEAAGFIPSLVIMDGTPRFEKTEPWEMDGVRRLARQWDAEIWTSCNTHREGQEVDAQGVPLCVVRFLDWLSVIINLQPSAEHIRVRVVKDHDRSEPPELRMELDPTTLLLRWR